MSKKKERKFTFALNVNENAESAVGHFLNVYDSGLMSKQYLLREAVVSGSFLHQLAISRGVVDLEASGQLSRMSSQDKARWLMAQCKMFLEQSTSTMGNYEVVAQESISTATSTKSEEDESIAPPPSSEEKKTTTKELEKTNQYPAPADIGGWGNMGCSED